MSDTTPIAPLQHDADDDPEPSERRDASPEPRDAAVAAPAPDIAGWPNEADPAAGLGVSLHLHTHDTSPPTAGWLDEQLSRAAAAVGVTSGRLEVTLIDDAAMAQLHGQYNGDPTTTDVLTFDLGDGETPHDAVFGDLVLCRDFAEREAARRGHDARLELLLYAVHGLLHLLGEDDHDDDDYQRMHEREDAILGELGFGALFSRTQAGGDA